MTTLFFNPETFRGLFPAFVDSVQYPDNILQIYWDTATAYASDTVYCNNRSFKLSQQTLALNLMTAHVATLSQGAATGQMTGVITASSIDKISVTLAPPPVPNQWRYWLNQTPYGAQLLALYEVASVGGFFVGGRAVRGSLW